jgi:hypothetical protein
LLPPRTGPRPAPVLPLRSGRARVSQGGIVGAARHRFAHVHHPYLFFGFRSHCFPTAFPRHGYPQKALRGTRRGGPGFPRRLLPSLY